MGEITIVGLDLAKNVFQVHGIDDKGNIIVRKRLRRADVVPFFEQLPNCLVGLEACASAHYWARAIAALGHTVQRMPPAYVKPYVKRGKTDAADAEGICEAVTRPTMRFVAIKTEEQQATLMLHKTRDLPAHYADECATGSSGRVWHRQRAGCRRCRIGDQRRCTRPRRTCPCWHGSLCTGWWLSYAASKWTSRKSRQKSSSGIEPTRRAAGWRRSQASARSRRARFAASVPDASLFRSGRQFAAWLGLTPKSHSSGGTERQVGISKQGDGVSSPPPGDRRDRRLAVRPAEQPGQGLGSPAARTQATEGGRRRIGQQDRGSPGR
jgi:transposase